MHYLTLIVIPKEVLVEDLNSALDHFLEPFDENTDVLKYLKFEEANMKDCENDYKTIKIPCVEVGGCVFPIYGNSAINQTFRYNHINHQLEWKYHKQMDPISVVDRVASDIYTFEEFMEKYYGFVLEDGKYGRYINPNPVFDWFDIGGRWPCNFVVPLLCDDCYIKSETLWNVDLINEDGTSCDIKDVASGLKVDEDGISIVNNDEIMRSKFKWVSAARKKNIRWDIMRKHIKLELEKDLEVYRKIYKKLKEMESDGTVSNASTTTLRDDTSIDRNRYHINTISKTLTEYGRVVYEEGITIDEFIRRYSNFNDADRYPFSCYGLFISSPENLSFEFINKYDNKPEEVREAIQKTIEEAGDDDWLVAIDIHD